MEVSISVNGFDIKFLSYMQENRELSFSNAVNVFPDKSIVGLKRSQARINYYLPDHRSIYCAGDMFHCNITYKEYLTFLKDITLNKYISSEQDRMKLILFNLFLYGTVNTSRLYQEIGVSLSTKKKDLKALSDFLQPYSLYLDIIKGQGISLRGNEFLFRTLIMKIISSFCEIDHVQSLIARAANPPYERLMFEKLQNDSIITTGYFSEIFRDILNTFGFDLSYPGKKSLLIYLMIMQKRVDEHNTTLILPGLEITLPLRNIFTTAVENVFVNNLIDSLDHNIYTLSYFDIDLRQTVTSFIQRIQDKLTTTISQHKELYDEVYIYLQKCLVRKKFLYDIPDVNLPKTQQHYPGIFSYVEDAISDIETAYRVNFYTNEKATLSLILKKFIINSKLAGRNRKNIAIVTTSTIEKVDFFSANLRCYIDIGQCYNININEIQKLSKLDHFITIVFSNRVSMLLQEKGIPHLKINYYITHRDIDMLIKNGLSSNVNRKISATDFAASVRNFTQDELIIYLKERYSNHFI